jgi:hypothetical protein
MKRHYSCRADENWRDHFEIVVRKSELINTLVQAGPQGIGPKTMAIKGFKQSQHHLVLMPHAGDGCPQGRISASCMKYLIRRRRHFVVLDVIVMRIVLQIVWRLRALELWVAHFRMGV